LLSAAAEFDPNNDERDGIDGTEEHPASAERAAIAAAARPIRPGKFQRTPTPPMPQTYVPTG